MADPIVKAAPYRLRVLQALTNLLETIRTSNGYDFDLQGNVFRGRLVYGASDPDTMLSIVEAPRPDIGRYAGEDQARVEGWSLLLQGWAPDDAEHPTDVLYLLASNVESCLAQIVLEKTDGSARPAFPESYMLGRSAAGQTLIASFRAGPPVIRAADPATTSSKANFYMQLTVGLAQNSV